MRSSIIDQTKLPHQFATLTLRSEHDAAHAIRAMQMRGAPLIGAVAAYGMALAMREDASDEKLSCAHDMLAGTRPTAINLRWALKRDADAVRNRRETGAPRSPGTRPPRLPTRTSQCAKPSASTALRSSRSRGREETASSTSSPTAMPAGWRRVDWGTALAPIYMAHDEGMPLHVWVDETRPRNQGASLTAFELGAHGVPHTIIADNAGGHYMQAGRRRSLHRRHRPRRRANGDVANKIGTYLKALAAQRQRRAVLRRVAALDHRLDAEIGRRDIPIEERDRPTKSRR